MLNVTTAEELISNKRAMGAEIPAEMRSEDKVILDRIRPFTMTSVLRQCELMKAVRYIVASGIRGDIVECGVWRGGSMMAIALTLLNMGVTDRDLYLYDTFEGMPSPTDKDVDVFGLPAAHQFHNPYVVACASFDEVKAAVHSTGYPAERIKIIKGKVEDTIPATIPERIALLRLDTDWYESTKHELLHLYPRLSLHGPMIIDDYGHWQGSRRAVDEYFEKIPLLLHYIDYSARVALKFQP